MRKFFAVSAIAFLLLSTAGCSRPRKPTPTAAHEKIHKHFVKYGKKYKQSDFGQHPIERVEIYEVRELQEGLAEADAYAHLSGGLTYKIRATFQKKPVGWKLVSWENLGR